MMITRFVIQLRVLSRTNRFPYGASLFENECVCCELSETIDGVFENLFLDFVACSRKHQLTSAICVPWSCVIATRLALHCVCDHENFMSFKIALLFNKVLAILGEILVLLVVWK